MTDTWQLRYWTREVGGAEYDVWTGYCWVMHGYTTWWSFDWVLNEWQKRLRTRLYQEQYHFVHKDGTTIPIMMLHDDG